MSSYVCQSCNSSKCSCQPVHKTEIIYSQNTAPIQHCNFQQSNYTTTTVIIESQCPPPTKTYRQIGGVNYPVCTHCNNIDKECCCGALKCASCHNLKDYCSCQRCMGCKHRVDGCTCHK